MIPFLALLLIAATALSFALTLWCLASVWFLFSLCRSAVRKSIYERRQADEGTLEHKRGGRQFTRPAAQCFRLNPGMLRRITAV